MPVDPERVARALTEIEQLIAADGGAARPALAGYLEPIVLRVVEDEGERLYQADVTLKDNMAALASGHVVDEASCGGRI